MPKPKKPAVLDSKAAPAKAKSALTEQQVVLETLGKGPQTLKVMCRLLRRPEGDTKLAKLVQKMHKQGQLQVVDGKFALATLKLCPGCQGKGWI